MGKLQTGRFERLGARTYSIKGPGALVDLDETVLGVLQLERQAGMESHLMQAWETFQVCQYTGPTAGKYAWVGLANPAGSGRIVVIDGWQRDSAIMLRTFITRGIAPGLNILAAAETPIDTRMSSGHRSAAKFIYDDTTAATFGVPIAQSATTEFQHQNIVLGPDGTLLFRANVVNEQLFMTIRYAEREAAPFELQ